MTPTQMVPPISGFRANGSMVGISLCKHTQGCPQMHMKVSCPVVKS